MGRQIQPDDEVVYPSRMRHLMSFLVSSVHHRRHLDEDGREHGEDECLNESDEDFETEERDRRDVRHEEAVEHDQADARADCRIEERLEDVGDLDRLARRYDRLSIR